MWQTGPKQECDQGRKKWRQSYYLLNRKEDTILEVERYKEIYLIPKRIRNLGSILVKVVLRLLKIKITLTKQVWKYNSKNIKLNF